MTVFEFATTLWSIMFSIAFAHMLASLARLLQLGRLVRWSPLHAIWWTSIFVCVVSNWISLWELRQLSAWRTEYILLLLLATFVQYLACYLVSPGAPTGTPINLNVFHEQQRHRYLFAFALMNAISIPLNIVTSHLFGVTSWGAQNLAQAPAAGLTLAALVVQRPRVEWILAVSVFGLTAYYLFGLQATIR